MSKNLYITALEPRSGKSVVALGIMELLQPNIDNISFFRPIINVSPNEEKDREIELIADHYNLSCDYDEMYAYTLEEAKEMIASNRYEELLEGILDSYNKLESKSEFVLCLGTDFDETSSAIEFGINAEIATNLGSPVFIVASGFQKKERAIINNCEYAIKSFEEKNCEVLGVMVNRVSEEECLGVAERLKERIKNKVDLVYSMPDDQALSSLTVREIAKFLDAKIVFGEDQLDRQVLKFQMEACQLNKCLDRLQEGSLLVTTGDRSDLVLGTVASAKSRNMPNVSGVLLTDGMSLNRTMAAVIDGLPDPLPILEIREDAFAATRKLRRVHTKISSGENRKKAVALNLFESHVDTSELRDRIIVFASKIVTPKMFEYGLIKRAKANKQHIVLPEGMEERMLRAAEALIHRDVVEITLLGKTESIENKISSLGLNMEGVNIVNPVESELFEQYVKEYYEMRKHKGITMDNARDVMAGVNYFGTMMVQKGDADGMVSGSIHSTLETIRPAFEIIKTKPDCTLVSSVMFMCLEDRVLAYGDCAVNPKPTAEEMADIAVNSAQTARIFGVAPRVAMLSYSTGTSGKGEDVDKVRTATEIAKGVAPELKVEGPIQYDAAVDPVVANTKLPNNEVAGKATVFIFPDLNTGNNTYKAVQRSANAIAIGPVLQGLNKPVNDLSRGCLIPDVINTIAITAIQAQAEKGLI